MKRGGGSIECSSYLTLLCMKALTNVTLPGGEWWDILHRAIVSFSERYLFAKYSVESNPLPKGIPRETMDSPSLQ